MRSLLLSAMVLGAFGCQTTDVRTNDGRALPPAPSAIPPAPAGITIDAMTLLVGQRPIDVDGDGYPDRIEVAVALFSEDYAAASLRVAGTFVFELVPQAPMLRPLLAGRWLPTIQNCSRSMPCMARLGKLRSTCARSLIPCVHCLG